MMSSFLVGNGFYFTSKANKTNVKLRCSQKRQQKLCRKPFPGWNRKYCTPHFWRPSSGSIRLRRTKRPLSHGAWGKEITQMVKKTAENCGGNTPNYMPVKIAAPFIGVSARQGQINRSRRKSDTEGFCEEVLRPQKR